MTDLCDLCGDSWGRALTNLILDLDWPKKPVGVSLKGWLYHVQVASGSCLIVGSTLSSFFTTISSLSFEDVLSVLARFDKG